MEGYSALSQLLHDALTKKHVRLHTAMEVGVLCVKLDKDNITQSRTNVCWSVRSKCSNT